VIRLEKSQGVRIKWKIIPPYTFESYGSEGEVFAGERMNLVPPSATS